MTEERQKRAVAIHDISCFGKCSLTVALPILSAAGIETSVIPTAVLSTHTGGFTGYTFKDLTDQINPIKEHWKSLSLSFDAVYTGFLGSFFQLEIISSFFDDFKGESLIFVDPVMGDNGSLYKTFNKEFPKGMEKLCKKADIIVPNLTEAALLLDRPYENGPQTRERVEKTLHDLSELGPSKAILTGVGFDNDKLGAAAFDKNKNEFCFYFSEKVEGFYHGTGDIFASVLLSAILNNKNMFDSIKAAVDFTLVSIIKTKKAGTDPRFGVNFEENLPDLIKELGLRQHPKASFL